MKIKGGKLIMYILNNETGIADKQLYGEILKDINRITLKGFFQRMFNKEIEKKDALLLTSLYIYDAKICNLEFLKYFPNLTELDIDCCGEIKDINGIHYLQKLQNLYLCNTYIEDLTPIAECRKVKLIESTVHDNEKCRKSSSELEFLSTMTNLNSLILSGNKVSNLAFLSKNNNLIYLNLDENPIEDLSILSELSNLKSLSIENCLLTSLDGIEKFTSLRQLSAIDNKLDEHQKEYYLELLSELEEVEL